MIASLGGVSGLRAPVQIPYSFLVCGRQIMSRSQDVNDFFFFEGAPPTTPFIFKKDGKTCCALKRKDQIN